MGASQSHEDSIHPQDSKPNLENNRVELKNPESNISVRPTEKKTSFVYSISSKKPEKTQIPYNYETILRDVDSPINTSTMFNLLSQLHYGVFLNQKRKRYWVDKNNKNCFMLFARDFVIAWAETSQVCWFELDGKFPVSKLSPSTLYEVVFIVMIKEAAFGWESGINLTLTLPNGQKIEHKETLMNKPREKWIEIPVGEFEASFDEQKTKNSGDLKIHIHQYDNLAYKSGLVVKGIAIRAKN
ncbi:phloem protein 2-like a1 [Gossypium australe]|uniref:Phloem protein 2-like a1 n=1 Tax=Gossypium australe TaxID=47621 RepID=A0A5B6W9M3_9ROSI|nr:phloem protein 2-like a1 [Gossypium australe]